MQKFHIKRNDPVVVIAGSHKGKEGKVLEILPGNGRARVEGLAMTKHHLKKSEKNPQGSIVEREGSIHLSNLMLKERHEARLARRGASAVPGEAPHGAAAAGAEAPPEEPSKT